MIYIFLADGFEEIEAIVVRDILCRNKIDIKTVGIGSNTISSCLGLSINTDLIDENIKYDDLEGIVLPGGMPGTSNLEKNKYVIDSINYCIRKNLLIGAICAAPSILGKMGLLKNKNSCCYPGLEKYLEGAIVSSDDVCIDNNIITSRGPGTAFKFGFEILRYLRDDSLVQKNKKSMVYSI